MLRSQFQPVIFSSVSGPLGSALFPEWPEQAPSLVVALMRNFLCGGVPLNQEGAPPSFVSSFQLDMTGAKQRLFPSTLN